MINIINIKVNKRIIKEEDNIVDIMYNFNIIIVKKYNTSVCFLKLDHS
jgi:hypothetical protein